MPNIIITKNIITSSDTHRCMSLTLSLSHRMALSFFGQKQFPKKVLADANILSEKEKEKKNIKVEQCTIVLSHFKVTYTVIYDI